MIVNYFVIAISLYSNSSQVGVNLLYSQRDEVKSKMPPFYL